MKTFIDANTPLPEDARDALKALADQQIPIICQAIAQKKLPTTYCHEIKSAFRALFDEDKLPVLSYPHQHYIPQLLRESMRLQSDKVSSRWNDHLLETFVNYNFNYMGIFNRWKELRDAEFAAAAAKGEEEDCYWKWEETISHYNPKADMAFDPSNQSLKVHMELYLKIMEKRLLYKKQAYTTELKKGIRTNNLAGDMAIRFITLQKTGEYDYQTQQEAAAAYSAVHISKNGNEVSVQTLTKHDKTALYMPAKKWHDKVVKIAKYLKKEYGFKDPN